MTAITFTSSEVVSTSSTGLLNRNYNFAQTVVAGQAVHLNGGTPQRWALADADASIITAGENGYGIAINGGSVGQPAIIATQAGAEVDFGAAATDVDEGELYCMGPVAGEIIPVSDMVTGNFTTILGYGKDTNIIVILPLRIPFVRLADVT
jgi:hypothetical protein